MILIEAFKREQIGGEIVLSMETTGMPSSTRARAVDELVRLGLIRVKRNGRQAVRVIRLRIR
jgi:DNA-binding IclR family transcriptional regulator